MRAGLVASVLLGALGVTLSDAASSEARARNGLIAYSQETNRCGGDGDCESFVWTVRSNGQGRRRLPCSTTTRPHVDSCVDVLPVFTPRGERLVTATNGVAEYTDDLLSKDILAVRDVDGEVLRRIPETGRAITALAWSGNAKQLAFATFRGIYIVGRDGTDQKRFAKLRGSDLTWSRWGQLAWMRDFDARLRVTNRARTRVRTLPVAGTSVAWSPNGRSLAYYVSEGRVRVVQIRRGALQAGRPRTVTDRCTGEVGIDVDTDIAWSPDGRQLLCATSVGDLISVNVRTGRARVVVRNGSRNAITSFDWQRAPRGGVKVGAQPLRAAPRLLQNGQGE